MGYNKEKASKFTHQQIIKNELVQDFLQRCEKINCDNIPDLEYDGKTTPLQDITDKINTNITHIITADGGYQEVNINDRFPSHTLCYYNVGILTFKVADLFALDTQQTIDPDDLGKLKDHLETFSFVVPMQNIKLKECDFKTSVRKTIFEIFRDRKLSGNDGDSKDSLLNTIKWLIFREYSDKSGVMQITCPNRYCDERLEFKRQTEDNYLDEKNNFIKCPNCGHIAYITDCFELHDLIDEIDGAGAITSYIMSVFEIVLLLCMFRFFMENNDEKTLSNILFIKDGPLALFSKLDDFAFKVIRPFMQFMYEKSLRDNVSYINFVGLDKSGMFVEHLKNIESKIYNIYKSNSVVMLPDKRYIENFITGKNKYIFGENTYFGIKMFVKKDENLSFVLDMAVPFGLSDSYKQYINNPKITDFLCLKSVLEILFRLKCDLYQNSTPMAFVPIALINKLVSISNVPSKKILTIFSKDRVK